MNIGKEFLTDTKFNFLWQEIELELDKLYTKSKCSGLLIYNNIYIVCTSTTTKYVEELYWKLGDFIYKKLRICRCKIFQSKNWVIEYNKEYESYKIYVESINELSDYLNQFITTKSIYHFAYLLWERCILQSCMKYKKISLGQFIVNYLDKDEVYKVIQSFKNILIDPKIPLLYYTEKYEQYALNSIKTKYEDFLKTYSFKSVVEYTNLIMKFILKERQNRKKTLLEESWHKLDLILEDLLVVRKKKYLRNEIYKILSQHKLPIEVLNNIRNSTSSDVQINNLNISEKSINTNKEYISTECMNINPFCTTFKHNPDFTEKYKEGFTHPVKDYHALYDNQNSSVYTFSSDILDIVKQCSNNLKIIEYGIKILDQVLIKYLDTELNQHKHLLDRKIESLYTFYNMFEKVVNIGFCDSVVSKETLNHKCRIIFNFLTPTLSTRLINFSTTIVTDSNLTNIIDLNLEEIKKEPKIDFYNKKETTNKTYIEIKDNVNSIQKDLVFSNCETPLIGTKHYKQKNTSLPDLSKELNSLTYHESALIRVYICLYELLDDKTVYFKLYIQEMCKRILLRRTNYNKETKLFEIMKVKCNNTEIIKTGKLILADMYKMYMNMTGIHFLSMSTWELPVDRLKLIYPDTLKSIMTSNMIDKNENHVFWSYEYSTVEVEIKDKIYKLNLLQYLVINLFNTQNKLTRSIIQDKTGLSDIVLDSVILSLTRSRLIKETNKIELNTEGCSLNVIDFYIKETENSFEIDKELFYQTKVSRIMKRNKFLSLEEIERVLRIEIQGFIFSSKDLMEGINTCIEKGIIEYKNDRYVYIP